MLKKICSKYGKRTILVLLIFGFCIALLLTIPYSVKGAIVPTEKTNAPTPTQIMINNHLDSIVSKTDTIKSITFADYQADMQKLEDWYVGRMDAQYEQLSHQVDWWLALLGIIATILSFVFVLYNFARFDSMKEDIRDKTENLNRLFTHQLKLQDNEFQNKIVKKTNEYQDALDQAIKKTSEELNEKIKNIDRQLTTLFLQKGDEFTQQIQMVINEINKTKELINDTKELELSVIARSYILKSSQLIITLNGLNEFHNKHFLKEEKGGLVTYMVQEARILLDEFMKNITVVRKAVDNDHLNILFLLILEQLRNFINLYEPYLFNPFSLQQIFEIRDYITKYSEKICKGEEYNPEELGQTISKGLSTIHGILQFEFHLHKPKKVE